MARDTSRPLNPTIKIDGAPMAKALLDNLLDLRVERRLRLPATFAMRFRDRDFALLDDSGLGLGNAVEILIPNDSGTELSVISAEVTAIGVDPGAGETHEFVVSGLDLAHRLTHNKEHRTYLNVAANAIVSQIAGRAGLSPMAKGPAHTFEYLLQVDSDHRFLDHLAMLCGCDWWVEKQELHFAPPAKDAAIKLTWGDDLRRFKLRLSTADQTGKVTVRGWDPATQKAVEGTDGGAATTPDAIAVGASSPVTDQLIKARKGLREVATGARTLHVDALTVAEATSTAKALAADLVATALHGRGEALGRPELTPGGWIEVANMGQSLSGTYALTEVEHVWGAGLGLVTRFSIGSRRPDELVDLLASGAAHEGPLGDASAAFNQVAVGLVSNIDDPDKLGRVKVKLPVLGEQSESGWCRVASPGAGANAGLVLHPNVDDEVLVVFERGDLRRGVVVGGLWSKTKAQPGTPVESSKVTKGLIRSRKGHVIELGDGDGDDAQHIKLLLANGTVLRVGADKVSLEVKKGPFSIQAGKGSIVISDSGDVTISGENVNIKATQSLSLQGTSSAELKSSTAVSVQGGTAEVKAQSNLNLQSGGMAALKGAMVNLG